MRGTWEGFKPCPFCGGTELDIDSEDYFNERLDAESDRRICTSVRCWNCSMELYDHTYDITDYNERIKVLRNKWNRRAE